MDTTEDSAAAILERFNPKWKDTAASGETLSVPAFVDSSTLPALADDVEAVRSASRQAMHALLMNAKVGGIVIAAFDSETMPAAIRDDFQRRAHSSQPGLASPVEKFVFKCDFLFMHPSIGMCVIEVKEFDSQQSSEEVYWKSVRELKESVCTTMAHLWKAIMHVNGLDEKCDVEVDFIVCCPNAELTTPVEAESTDFIDNRHFESESLAEDFWHKKLRLHESVDVNLFRTNERFQLFIKTAINCRSVAYVSGVKNALTVAQTVMSQKPPPNTTAEHEAMFAHSAIFLTPEQLKAVECNDQRQLIIGPPGTGKSLVLMLQALKVAKSASRHKLFVLCWASFDEKLKAFFVEHKDELALAGREIIFGCNVADSDIGDDDDVFRDEMGLSVGVFLEKRRHSAGRTVCVVTGNHTGANYERMRGIGEQFTDAFTLHELNTVIRGTTNIIKHWRGDFNGLTVVPGHDHRCDDVVTVKVPTVDAAFRAVVEQVIALLDAGVEPNDIGVIAERENDATINLRNCLHRALKERRLPASATTAREQVTDEAAVAVDDFMVVMSFEWPFVVVCSTTCADMSESFMMVAGSRAMGRLIVVERDYQKVQRTIDDSFITGKRTHASLLDRDWLYYMVVGEGEKEDNAERLVDFHRDLTILRTNALPRPKNYKGTLFSSCKDFTGALQMLIDDKERFKKFVASTSFSAELLDRARRKIQPGRAFRAVVERNRKFLRRALEMTNGHESGHFERLFVFAAAWADVVTEFFITNERDTIAAASKVSDLSAVDEEIWSALVGAADLFVKTQCVDRYITVHQK